MSKEYRIAVGIPTLNEAATIANVVRNVDRGVAKYFPDLNAIILNVDSYSGDNTRSAFQSTPTHRNKLSILGEGEVRGKGSNLFALLNFVVENDIHSICTVDGDIRSISPIWLRNLLEPIVSGEVDYVTPLYKRNRFEGSTTNHLCVPVLKAIFGGSVRQPIGGEFAFSLSFARYVLGAEKPMWAHGYGIDIFLTTHAIGGGFRVAESYLGRKIHNPSFGKMVPMFREVCSTMLCLVHQYRKFSGVSPQIKTGTRRIGVDKQFTKPKEELIEERYQYAVGELTDVASNFKLYPFKKELLSILEKNSYKVNKLLWEQVLADLIRYVVSLDSLDAMETERLSRIVTPLFLLRVLSFYREIEGLSPRQIENMLEYNISVKR